MNMNFEIEKTSGENSSRAGRLYTPHGNVDTPVFMAVGTQATVKALTPDMLRSAGCSIILGNNYHLNLRPTVEVIEKAGGLHSFMGWDGPILTDSGGYQVFSLCDLVRVKDEGVEFASPLNGDRKFFSPEEVVRSQSRLGSDVMMILDECVAWPHTRAKAEKAAERTLRWAIRSREEFEKLNCKSLTTGLSQYLFGIVQGGAFRDLREESARSTVDVGFDGYAIGGVSVGEPRKQVRDTVNFTSSFLPENKPRYVMGLGDPADIVHAVASGADMFDCVIPTRHGRNGWLYTSRGRIVIRNAPYREDFSKPDPDCSCYTCSNFSRAYLHHLFRSRELLGYTLNSLHNLHYMLKLLRRIRESIISGRFEDMKKEILRYYE